MFPAPECRVSRNSLAQTRGTARRFPTEPPVANSRFRQRSPTIGPEPNSATGFLEKMGRQSPPFPCYALAASKRRSTGRSPLDDPRVDGKGEPWPTRRNAPTRSALASLKTIQNTAAHTARETQGEWKWCAAAGIPSAPATSIDLTWRRRFETGACCIFKPEQAEGVSSRALK